MLAAAEADDRAGLAPNPRFTHLRRHAVQQQYWRSTHRFNVVPAGRRSGKTEIAKRRLVRALLSTATEWEPQLFAAAPTRDQAKRIFWEDLKRMVGRDFMARPPSETELCIHALTGGKLWVVGLDKPERIEGTPWDGGVIDEIANTKPGAWEMNVRPALSTEGRRGWCDLIGVPEGRNHYYDLHKKALQNMSSLGEQSEWAAYGWPSADILAPEEIAAAMQDLDELTFNQEYRASFVSFEGRAYYRFQEESHCARLRYDDRAPLALCFDFNVEPGAAAAIQEQPLPGQYEHDLRGLPVLSKPIVGTGVIAEVHIPRNSTTPAVCRKLLEMFGAHKGRVVCYGDATGGARGSAKVEGSDWELIEKELRPRFKDRLFFDVDDANPAERARVNAVNSRLRSVTGDVRLMVDGAKCPQVVKCFEGTVLLKGGSGEIDKKETPKLTHWTDGIGYYVHKRFPVAGAGLSKMRVSGA
jgi:hypothetical protein